MTTEDEQWLQRVRYTAAEPAAWLSQADILRQAAEDLWHSGNAHDRDPGSLLGAKVWHKWTAPGFVAPETGGMTRDVCFMVFGFALENLAKGIKVCRDPRLVTRDEWRGSGHNLSRLFKEAGIDVSEQERETLQRVTRIVEWKGRYPVAKTFDRVGVQDTMAGHIAWLELPQADEFARLCHLYDRAKAALIETMAKIPPLPADFNFGPPIAPESP